MLGACFVCYASGKTSCSVNRESSGKQTGMAWYTYIDEVEGTGFDYDHAVTRHTPVTSPTECGQSASSKRRAGQEQQDGGTEEEWEQNEDEAVQEHHLHLSKKPKASLSRSHREASIRQSAVNLPVPRSASSASPAGSSDIVCPVLDQICAQAQSSVTATMHQALQDTRAYFLRRIDAAEGRAADSQTQLHRMRDAYAACSKALMAVQSLLRSSRDRCNDLEAKLSVLASEKEELERRYAEYSGDQETPSDQIAERDAASDQEEEAIEERDAALAEVESPKAELDKWTDTEESDAVRAETPLVKTESESFTPESEGHEPIMLRFKMLHRQH